MAAVRKVVIIGDSAFAEVAHEYFTHDSDYDVVGFAVERAYLQREKLADLPVVPVEEMEQRFPPGEYGVYVAIVYSQLNRLRTRLLGVAEAKGYHAASYVSSRAHISPSARLGRHCFVFEGNVVQPFVQIGDNVVLWSGNHIGHHSRIENNCFISSHVVVSGFCTIGESSFLGVNAAVADNITVARDTWIGPGVVVQSDTAQGEVHRVSKSRPAKVGSRRLFKVGP